MVCAPESPPGSNWSPVTPGPEKTNAPPEGTAETRVVRSMGGEVSHTGTGPTGTVSADDPVTVNTSSSVTEPHDGVTYSTSIVTVVASSPAGLKSVLTICPRALKVKVHPARVAHSKTGSISTPR